MSKKKNRKQHNKMFRKVLASLVRTPELTNESILLDSIVNWVFMAVSIVRRKADAQRSLMFSQF